MPRVSCLLQKKERVWGGGWGGGRLLPHPALLLPFLTEFSDPGFQALSISTSLIIRARCTQVEEEGSNEPRKAHQNIPFPGRKMAELREGKRKKGERNHSVYG